MLRVGLRPSLNQCAFKAAGQCRSQVFVSRAFSTTPKPNVLQSIRRQPTILSTSLLSRFSRTITTDAEAVVSRPSQAESWRKFGITAATVAGTILVAETFMNRETRDGLTEAEQSYLHDSFKYTGGGLALTALAARSLFKSGVAFRIMSANPWAVLGASLVGSIGSMMGVMYTSPENTVQKACILARLQCVPSSDAVPVILHISCHPLPRCALHLRSSRFPFIYRCNSQKRHLSLPRGPIARWCDRRGT